MAISWSFRRLLRPGRGQSISRILQWLNVALTRRYHKHHRFSEYAWQERFKSFPIQDDYHLLTLLRYVERKPVRPGLVSCAEQWRWSRLWRRLHPDRNEEKPALDAWPIPRPDDWLARVNRA